ncbi:hypothetical protein BV22DRAFT_683443 [Leucogyrophana mollusca]|uniref:Uncharacterized protein n=1 Tax=Leucogyrophana mollusca TaxID=85980 RepID=A0ACB8B9C6_9AGAM|nr:hypothetical protein BV22DRAFT_683443 [Leucogyrophana mollusca]
MLSLAMHPKRLVCALGICSIVEYIRGEDSAKWSALSVCGLSNRNTVCLRTLQVVGCYWRSRGADRRTVLSPTNHQTRQRQLKTERSNASRRSIAHDCGLTLLLPHRGQHAASHGM